MSLPHIRLWYNHHTPDPLFRSKITTPLFYIMHPIVNCIPPRILIWTHIHNRQSSLRFSSLQTIHPLSQRPLLSHNHLQPSTKQSSPHPTTIIHIQYRIWTIHQYLLTSHLGHHQHPKSISTYNHHHHHHHNHLHLPDNLSRPKQVPNQRPNETNHTSIPHTPGRESATWR